MKQMGFTRVFTSLHIPEDDPQKVIETLQQLKKLTQKLQVDLMADVSSTGLQRLAIDLNQPKACEQLKI
nr:MupG family TIM beta-alpha barrel fold protein [Tetragenococcus muriaticus]